MYWCLVSWVLVWQAGAGDALIWGASWRPTVQNLPRQFPSTYMPDTFPLLYIVNTRMASILSSLLVSCLHDSPKPQSEVQILYIQTNTDSAKLLAHRMSYIWLVIIQMERTSGIKGDSLRNLCRSYRQMAIAVDKSNYAALAQAKCLTRTV